MKIRLSVLLCVVALIIPCLSMAEMWVVCSPQVGVEGYGGTLDGEIFTNPYDEYGIGQGAVAKVVKVQDVPNGDHLVVVYAFQGSWKSSSVNFTFSGGKLNVPANVSLQDIPSGN